MNIIVQMQCKVGLGVAIKLSLINIDIKEILHK